MKLSERVRPDVEAAPWVIEEIKKLEEELADANDMLKRVGEIATRTLVQLIDDE